MSWGNKIVLVFIAFVGLIGTLVFCCMQQNFELVSKDYYKDEIAYQDRIDGSSNANKLSKVIISQRANDVQIKLPGELKEIPVTGEAWFYCATSADNDRRLPLKLTKDGEMLISKSIFAGTHYLVKLNWQADNKKYYYEQTINIQ